MLIIHSLNGKNIEKFSHHPEEEEVLFEPYSSFRVVDKFLDAENYILPFIVYELEEVMISKELPGGKDQLHCLGGSRSQRGHDLSAGSSQGLPLVHCVLANWAATRNWSSG